MVIRRRIVERDFHRLVGGAHLGLNLPLRRSGGPVFGALLLPIDPGTTCIRAGLARADAYR
jgi:hypothetical protein